MGSLKASFSKEKYSVKIERDAATGVATRERWFNDGRLHRVDGPAFIERDAAPRITTDEQWFKDGQAASAPATKTPDVVASAPQP